MAEDLSRPIINEKALLAYDLCIDETTYGTVERDFQEIVGELAGDSQLEPFRFEYEKIFLAVRKARENERFMVQQVRELAQSYAFQNQKTKTVQRMLKEDISTIEALRLDLQAAEEAKTSGISIVDRNQEQREQLETQVNDLKSKVDTAKNGGNMGTAEELLFDQLNNQLKAVENEYQSKISKNEELEKEIIVLKQKTQMLQQQKELNEIKVKDLREEVIRKKEAANQFKLQKQKVEAEMLLCRQKCDELDAEINENLDENEQQKLKLKTSEESNFQHKQLYNKYLNEKKQQEDRLNELKQQLQDIFKSIKLLSVQIHEKSLQIEAYLEEQKQSRIKIQIIQQKTQEINGQIAVIQEQKNEIDQKIEKTKADIIENDVKCLEIRVQNNEIQKKIDIISRDKQNQAKQQKVTEMTVAEKEQLKQILSNQQKSYESELVGYRGEIQRIRDVIYQQSKEKESFFNIQQQLTAQNGQLTQEQKQRDGQIQQLQKQVRDSDQQLQIKQQLHEQMTAEKNICAKSLVEAQEKITELRHQFRVMSHVIDQLRAEIKIKDENLLVQHMQFKDFQKEKDKINQQLEKAKIQLRDGNLRLQKQKAQIAQQQFIIQEAEVEINRQSKEYQLVEAEKHTIGQIVIQRNSELQDVLEKIRVQKSILIKGERQYKERVEQIQKQQNILQQLRNEVLDLRQKCNLLDPLKSEINLLQKQQYEEKAKMRALTQELQQPMNVHRWRQLEGSDPQTYDLIKKVQELQKILISKTQESQQKEIEIAEKEKIYNELKKVLSRLPGQEKVEKLENYRQSLKDKLKELNDAKEELGIYQVQCEKLKTEIENTTQQLAQLKLQYFELKTNETKQIVDEWRNEQLENTFQQEQVEDEQQNDEK